MVLQQQPVRSLFMAAAIVALAAGHGAIVSPRSRNSVDYLAGISGIDNCVNITGAKCENGQAAHWYSQVHRLVAVTAVIMRAFGMVFVDVC